MALGEGLDRNSGLALWLQVRQRLAEEIGRGIHAPGERLPTEAALAERFGVNRHTLRRAMAALHEDGLIRIEQGRGTFVQEHLLDYALGRRTRFSEIVGAEGRRPGARLLRAAEIPAPTAAARALGVARGSLCAWLETVREADGRPITLSDHYFPAKRYPDFIAVYRETGSISAALTRFGAGDYQRKWTRITARPANSEESRHLAQPPNRPVLVAESLNVDGAGRPVEYGLARFASERVQLIVEPLSAF